MGFDGICSDVTESTSVDEQGSVRSEGSVGPRWVGLDAISSDGKGCEWREDQSGHFLWMFRARLKAVSE